LRNFTGSKNHVYKSTGMTNVNEITEQKLTVTQDIIQQLRAIVGEENILIEDDKNRIMAATKRRTITSCLMW